MSDKTNEKNKLETLEKRVQELEKEKADLKATLELESQEHEKVSMDLAIGLSEAFVVLQKISQGDFSLRASEDVENELLARLGTVINRTNDALAAAKAQTQNMIKELATPVIRVWDEVLVLPLIGTLDSQRAQHVMETLLERITKDGARIVILDITGVPYVDSLVASNIAQTMEAVKLVGAEGMLTGIRAQVAQTLVKMGVKITGVETKANLAEGLKEAFRRLGVKAIQEKQPGD